VRHFTLGGRIVYIQRRHNSWLELQSMFYGTVVPLALSFLILLYIVLNRLLKSKIAIQNHSPHNLKLKFSKSDSYTKKRYCCLLTSSADEIALNSAIELGGKAANYTLIHVVETVGAMIYGENIDDHETSVDENYWKNTK
jgi:manganese transport protein